MLIKALNESIVKFEEHNFSPKLIRKTANLASRVAESKIDRDKIHKLQFIRLKNTLEYVYENSPFYQEKFDKENFHPGDVTDFQDLEKLSFTDDEDIRDWKKFLCVDESELSAVYTSQGTTGEPKKIYYTYKELQSINNLYATALKYLHPDRLVALIAFPVSHGLWFGSPTTKMAVERAGGLPIPIGSDDPQETLEWMNRFDPNLIFSTPSFMTSLTKKAEEKGYQGKIDNIILGGEMLKEDRKEYIRNYWDAEVADSYGSVEIGGGQTIALSNCNCLHLNDLHLYTEIIDPETGDPADQGELVFTSLRREGMPLIRFRSGDLASWSECDCFLPLRGIKLLGRLDDVVVISEMNLYGSVVVDEISKIPESKGRLLMEVEMKDLTDHLKLVIEATSEIDRAQVIERISNAYPEFKSNVEKQNFVLEVETVDKLEGQLKSLKVRDHR